MKSNLLVTTVKFAQSKKVKTKYILKVVVHLSNYCKSNFVKLAKVIKTHFDLG